MDYELCEGGGPMYAKNSDFPGGRVSTRLLVDGDSATWETTVRGGPLDGQSAIRQSEAAARESHNAALSAAIRCRQSKRQTGVLVEWRGERVAYGV